MSQKFDLVQVLNLPALPKYLERVETCMRTALNAHTSALTNASLRMVNTRGKRLRPSLVIASYLLSHQEINQKVIDAAAAVELIHIGSLIHDDIIDEAAERWNKPTINAQEGENLALLAGDYVFAKGCQLASQVSQPTAALAADTIARLCIGQAAETETLYDLNRSQAQLNSAIDGKTAVLMEAACKMGGICAGMPEKELQVLADFAHSFGTGFQLVDDVLDFISSEALLGKPVGNDLKEGVYTLPVILALKGKNGTKVASLAKQNDYQTLTKLLLSDGNIGETLATAHELNHHASQILKNKFGETALAELPQQYMDWALSNMVAADYKAKLSIT